MGSVQFLNFIDLLKRALMINESSFDNAIKIGGIALLGVLLTLSLFVWLVLSRGRTRRNRSNDVDDKKDVDSKDSINK